MNPDNLLDEVTNASTTSEYQNALNNIRQYNKEVRATTAAHDGRTPKDLLDEADNKLDEGTSGWNESSINELLKEAIVRISDEE